MSWLWSDSELNQFGIAIRVFISCPKSNVRWTDHSRVLELEWKVQSARRRGMSKHEMRSSSDELPAKVLRTLFSKSKSSRVVKSYKNHENLHKHRIFQNFFFEPWKVLNLIECSTSSSHHQWSKLHPPGCQRLYFSHEATNRVPIIIPRC